MYLKFAIIGTWGCVNLHGIDLEANIFPHTAQSLCQSVDETYSLSATLVSPSSSQSSHAREVPRSTSGTLGGIFTKPSQTCSKQLHTLEAP
jgi:hypothetical protein